MFKLIKIDEINLICYKCGIILRQTKTKKWIKFVSKKKEYWRININRKFYMFHRLICHAFLGFDLNSNLMIDHIDRDIHNNKVENLRIVTNQQNMFNTNAKGYTKRIYIKKDGTEVIYWETQIKINEKIIRKCFKTEDEAKNHYLELKAIYHVI